MTANSPSDVPAAIAELGVRISKVDDQAGEVSGWCPAHFDRTGKQDSHPSWSVNMENGLHHCFSCGWKGNFASLVSYVTGMSSALTNDWISDRETYAKEIQPKVREEEKREPIGEADLALFTYPPYRARKPRGISQASVEDYGILWDNKTESWVFPVREPYSNKLLGWQEKADEGRHFKNHPRGVKKGHTVFGLQPTLGIRTGIIVESPRDCAAIASAGISGAVSTMGASITGEQIDLLVRQFYFIVSALDFDEAGDKGNQFLMENIPLHRLKFWNYPDALPGEPEYRKDPGDQSPEEIRHSYSTAYRAIGAKF